MPSPIWWTWVWASYRSWRWTGKPGMLQSMGLQRVRHDWATEVNWTELKQGNNIQPWHTPFPIWNQSIALCPVLTATIGPTYRFLRKQVRWSGISSLEQFSTVCCDPHKDFSVVNEGEVDAFLDFSCFFYDPMDFGNLISGSSAFSKSSLSIWKFLVHILLKPSLENFEHCFECVEWVQLCNSLNILWHRFSLGLVWKVTFSSPVACWVFQICWHNECSTFTASSSRIWNSSTGIPSPPLALFVVKLPKATLALHSRMSGSRWWSHHNDYLGCEDLFCLILLFILATSS